jgi:hypothetical protein
LLSGFYPLDAEPIAGNFRVTVLDPRVVEVWMWLFKIVELILVPPKPSANVRPSLLISGELFGIETTVVSVDGVHV